ncbi:hypothetical protein FOZ63_002189, partial [Perkinsus olseni]
AFKEALEQAQTVRFGVVQTIGPACFVVRNLDESTGPSAKFRVKISNTHACSCSGQGRKGDRTNEEYCPHVLFVLHKVLRLSAEDPLLWQLALCDREVEDILSVRSAPSACSSNSKAISAPTSVGDGSVKRREIETTTDLCPICHDLLGPDDDFLTYCRYACGGNIHVDCMKAWADHNTNTATQEVSCPLCRVGWPPGTRTELQRKMDRLRATKLAAFPRTRCWKCRTAPIRGKYFQCLLCYRKGEFCQHCYQCHAQDTGHPFVVLKNPRKFAPLPVTPDGCAWAQDSGQTATVQSTGAPSTFRALVGNIIDTFIESNDERLSLCKWPCGHSFNASRTDIRWSIPCPVCGEVGLPGLAKLFEYYGKSASLDEQRDTDKVEMSIGPAVARLPGVCRSLKPRRRSSLRSRTVGARDASPPPETLSINGAGMHVKKL